MAAHLRSVWRLAHRSADTSQTAAYSEVKKHNDVGAGHAIPHPLSSGTRTASLCLALPASCSRVTPCTHAQHQSATQTAEHGVARREVARGPCSAQLPPRPPDMLAPCHPPPASPTPRLGHPVARWATTPVGWTRTAWSKAQNERAMALADKSPTELPLLEFKIRMYFLCG